MRSLFIYRVLFIIIAVMLTVVPYSAAVSGSSFVSVIDDIRKEIISISTTGKNNGTTITVLSGKTMTVLNNMVIKSPNRIIYDIKYDGPSFTSVSKNLKTPNLKSFRVGYHSGNIRIVLDVNGTKMPKFSHRVSNHELIIFVETEQKGNGKKVKAKEVPRQNIPIASKISVLPEENNHTNPDKDLSVQSLKEPSIIVEELEPKHIVTEKVPQIDLSVLLLKKMTEFEPNGQSEEAALFLTGITAFKDKDFQKAGDSLKNLIKAYPKGQYSEKAYFLLAKSLDQLYVTSLSENYFVIKNSYDDAIYRYPSSVFVPDALLSAGNLCLKAKYISEAIAYYNRIIKKNNDSFFTVRALLQKGEALYQKKKYSEALSIYENITLNHNDFEKTEAELGIAKILFGMNSFQKSINLLTNLEKDPENLSRYPDILLYLGYNYYQKGYFTEAINNLFQYSNICPDSSENHLILNKIGDAYRAKSMSDSASKIYRLVFDRFPKTEGALISLTRLAEQLESGELKNKHNFIFFSDSGQELSSAYQIYEKVISEYLSIDSKSPLLEYAMLKLALLYKKDNNYSKSMEVLDNLLNKYPSSKLRPEIIYALSDNFETIIKDKKNSKDNNDAYLDIIKIYLKNKHIIQRLAPPRTLFAVALACIRLGLEDTAIELFMQADNIFPDKEKPEELLYYLGKHLLENGQQRNGLIKLDLLIAQYRLGEFVAKAYHVKGTLFWDNKQYAQAIDMFSQALNSHPAVEDKIMILTDMAKVFDMSGLKAKSLEALKEAENILAKTPQQDEFVYQKIGEIYLNLGKPEDALLLLNNIMATQENNKENLKSMFIVAQCYEALNRKSECISVYNQLVKSDDPLWSSLAKERMEAIIFKELLTKSELKKSRR
ncbi:MAG: tetratricopeptide repeat protein [Proteobacteria bacterium]|nr:tetratricopeptide repeat protein [Pseudomonadota bacterium]